MTSDTGLLSSRINQRLVAAPAKAVLTSAWLKERGISSKLAGYYASSGWLHRMELLPSKPERPLGWGPCLDCSKKPKPFTREDEVPWNFPAMREAKSFGGGRC